MPPDNRRLRPGAASAKIGTSPHATLALAVKTWKVGVVTPNDQLHWLRSGPGTVNAAGPEGVSIVYPA